MINIIIILKTTFQNLTKP